MGDRAITYTLLGVIIIIFIAYFTSLTKVYPWGKKISGELNNIIQYTQAEKWDEAEESVKKLITAWDKVKHLVTFNYAEEDYSIFIENLARIQGGIKTKGKTETVNQALSMLDLWKNFNRIIPQP